MLRQLILCGVMLSVAGCVQTESDQIESNNASLQPSLAESFSDSFLIGTAIAPAHYERLQSELIRQHFNAAVAENVMKSL